MLDADLLQLYDAGRARSPAARALAVLTACAAVGGDDPARLARLPLGRRNELLLRSWPAQWGDLLEAVAACAGCGETLEVSVRAADLLAGAPATSGAPAELLVGGGTVRATPRAPDSVDLEAAAAAGSPAAARRALRDRCVRVVTPDGERVDPDRLPAPLAAELAAAVDAALATADPLAAISLELACPSCGSLTETLLDPAAQWWAAVEQRAVRVLGEVHRLALAYGWSERDILALGPARRSAYLELVP